MRADRHSNPSPFPGIGRRSLRAIVWVLTLFVLKTSYAEDSNWPQWRGPQMTGVSPRANPPITWSEKEHIKWNVSIPGKGLATPVVWENRVFIQTAIPRKKELPSEEKNDDAGKSDSPPARDDAPRRGNRPDSGNGPRSDDQPRRVDGPADRGRPGGRGMGGQLPTEKHQWVLMCLDRETGKTLWQQVAREEVPHEGIQFDNTFASYSPVTDGKCVVAYFGSRGLHCYDMQGNLKWEKDLGRMKTKLSFGEGSSPALFGNAVIVNWDHEGPGFIAAFDKETGNELWRTSRDEVTSWSTPVVIEHNGKSQVVVAATHKVRSYDLTDGKLLWECAGLTTNAIPTPVAGNGLVYATTGFRGSVMLAIRPEGSGDVTGTDYISWTLKKGTPYVPSPLLYDDRLYFFASNNAVLSCVDAKSGKPIYDGKRIEDMQGVYASPVGAAGRVYLVGRNGTTVVIKHGDKFEALATNHLDDQFDASPALAGRELFLRGRESLYCIAEN
jgi:outer membrane protein assembly factor BamB